MTAPKHLHESTRGEAPELTFSDAVLAGLARDGGLYWPKEWPIVSHSEIAAFAGQSYAQVAENIVGRFADDIDSKALTLSATGIYGWKTSESNMIGTGIARTYRAGRLIYVPVILWNKTFNDRCLFLRNYNLASAT